MGKHKPLIGKDSNPEEHTGGWLEPSSQPLGPVNEMVEIFQEQTELRRRTECFDELVEALEECLNVLTEPGMMDVDEWKAWKRAAEIKAHKALAKAKGES